MAITSYSNFILFEGANESMLQHADHTTRIHVLRERSVAIDGVVSGSMRSDFVCFVVISELEWFERQCCYHLKSLLSCLF